MDFWDQVWATVLGGVIVVIVGSIGAWLIARTRQGLGKRPDWKVKYTASGSLEFTRERRHTAYEIGGHVYGPRGAVQVEFTSLALISDYQRGDKFHVALDPNAAGAFFSWIDGERLSIDFPIPTNLNEPISLTAKRPKRHLRWMSA